MLNATFGGVHHCGRCVQVFSKSLCRSSLLFNWSFRHRSNGRKAKRSAQTEPDVVKSAAEFSATSKSEPVSIGSCYPCDLASIQTVPFVLDNADEKKGSNDQETGAKFRFPSVTKILERTRSAESRELFTNWRNNMIEKYGQEKFDSLVSDRLKIGTALHEALTMQYLTLQTPVDEVQLSESAVPYWNSLKPLLPCIEELVSKEAWVNHSVLHYKGRIDALLKYKNRVVLLELKTSDRVKASLDSLYDTPLQLVAYAGALNSMPDYPKITDAIIIVCYTSSEATVFELNIRYLEYYWKQWLQRLSNYWADLGKMHR